MNHPRRWKDDPEFAELLRGESEALGGTDMEALRSRVLNGSPPPSPSWRPGRGWIGIGIGIGIAILMLRPSAEVMVPSPPVTFDVMEHISSTQLVVERAEVRILDSQPVDVAPPPLNTAVVSPPSEAEPAPSAPVQVEPDPQPPVPSVDPSLDAPAQVPSPLEAELEAYNLALRAEEGERWPEARVRYEAYLGGWPNGRLRNEANMSLLIATVRSGAYEDAQRLASTLLERPKMRSRRPDILWIKSQALVELNRCEDALQSLDEFDAIRKTAESRRLRATCRRRR